MVSQEAEARLAGRLQSSAFPKRTLDILFVRHFAEPTSKL